MKTLELKDIYGYLPYGLCMRLNSKTVVMESCYNIHDEILTFQADYRDNFRVYQVNGFEQIKPVLRPISDLYNTITHNGKEIVPIVECAKIGTGYEYWYFNGKEAEYDTDYDYYHFDYYNGIFGYSSNLVINFIAVFDFLNELKIDYRGLIDTGLAVSVYDLDSNPYK